MAEERKCKYCGQLFIPVTHRQFYCNESCRLERNRERSREQGKSNTIQRRKQKAKKAAIRDIAAEAKAAGMSYGQYVAMKGL